VEIPETSVLATFYLWIGVKGGVKPIGYIQPWRKGHTIGLLRSMKWIFLVNEAQTAESSLRSPVGSVRINMSRT
jgi:hypothetical protein